MNVPRACCDSSVSVDAEPPAREPLCVYCRRVAIPPVAVHAKRSELERPAPESGVAPVAPRKVQNGGAAGGPASIGTELLEKRIEDFIVASRDDILTRTRTMVVERSFPRACSDEVSEGIPLLLDQLTERLCRSNVSGAIASGAAKHGRELLRLGMSVTQVVHDFAATRRAIVDVAGEVTSIPASELLAIDRALDDVISHTVTEYSRQRERANAREAAERLGTLAHEIRNHLSTAHLAFGLVDDASDGGARALGTLGRSLRGLTDLVERSFSEVRLDSGVRRPRRISISELVEQIGSAATMEADARGLQLTVTGVAPDVEVEGDRQILADAVTNLLQNAFKFTRATGRVRLSTHAVGDRVLIEVDDECGGLLGLEHDQLFRPFEQRCADRSGLGIGLAISRRGVEASGGKLVVRNRPGVGCTFVVDLPRLDRCELG